MLTICSIDNIAPVYDHITCGTVAMAKCRKQLDWEGQFNLALDPEKARRLRVESGVDEEYGACTICGEFCDCKVMNERRSQELS